MTIFDAPGCNDDRRYVAVGSNVENIMDAITWLRNAGLKDHEWSRYPFRASNKERRLAFFFPEPVSLELIMRFKLTWA